MKNYHITSWNVENPFDIEDSPLRPEYLQGQLKSDLEIWNTDVLEKS